MIELWLRAGAWAIIVLPFILLYSIAAAIVWLTHESQARPFFASCIGIGAPFFVSVATGCPNSARTMFLGMPGVKRSTSFRDGCFAASTGEQPAAPSATKASTAGDVVDHRLNLQGAAHMSASW